MLEINPRDLKLFVVKETTSGTLAFPAQANALRVAAYPELTEQVSYSDSEEIRNSLNLADRTQDKKAAGTLKLKILARLDGVGTNLIKPPMGDVLFQALMGKKAAFSALVGVGGVSSGDVSIPFDTLSGDWPPSRGVLHLSDGLNDELVYYSGLTQTDATSGSFTGCVRGYAGSTAAAFLATDAVALANPAYIQQMGRPTFSVWYQMGEVIWFARGCTVSTLALSLANKGNPTFDLDGGFMERGRAGKATLNGAVTASTVLTLAAGEAKRFTLGARIQNVTAADTNAGAGYEVVAVDTLNHQITLASAVTWANGAVIQGYLPAHLDMGAELKSADSMVQLDAVEAVPTGGNINISAPIRYLDEEISPNPPTDFVEQRRDIKASLESVFKTADLELIHDAEEGTTRAFGLRLGDGTAGMTLWVDLPKCHLQIPPTQVADEVVKKTLELTALDSDVERSAFISIV
ncbi:MAG: phage tail tube protein [bacterium]|nr:phage tail tube protein [bacterium]